MLRLAYFLSLSVLVLVAGCSSGIPEGQYQAAIVDRDKAIQEKDNAFEAKGALTVELAAVKESLTQAQEQVASLDNRIIEVEGENNQLKGKVSDLEHEKAKYVSDLADEKVKVEALSRQLGVAETELAALKAKFPLRRFDGLADLEAWVTKHKMSVSDSAEATYQNALSHQKMAADDGYLISVVVDMDDQDGFYLIWAEASTNSGWSYIWNPEEAVVYRWVHKDAFE